MLSWPWFFLPDLQGTTLGDVLGSRSFLETIAVLIIGAVITGLAVPLVKNPMDTRRFKKERSMQEAISRKTKFIDSQAELLEVLAKVLGGLRMLHTKVAFYAKEGRVNDFRTAFKKYEERSWDLLASYRTELSKAGRLTPPPTHQALRDLYYDVLIPTDRRLYKLIKESPPRKHKNTKVWAEFFDYMFTDFTDAVDGALKRVTDEIRATEA